MGDVNNINCENTVDEKIEKITQKNLKINKIIKKDLNTLQCYQKIYTGETLNNLSEGEAGHHLKFDLSRGINLNILASDLATSWESSRWLEIYQNQQDFIVKNYMGSYPDYNALNAQDRNSVDYLNKLSYTNLYPAELGSVPAGEAKSSSGGFHPQISRGVNQEDTLLYSKMDDDELKYL